MKELLNAILYPITSTQLGVFANFLDIRKLDVLAAIDNRALEFKRRFLDVFVQGHLEEIEGFNEAKTLHRDAGRIVKEMLDKGITTKADIEKWQINWEDYDKINGMKYKIYKLRELFKDDLKTADPHLTELSSDFLSRKIRNSPRFVAGMSHTFNLLGTIGATYSVLKEAIDPTSDVRQHKPEAIAAVVATAIGGIGSAYGTFTATIDLMKIIKQRFFGPPRPTTRFYGVRSSEELVTIEQELATEVSVDLTNMERASNRLARMASSKTIGRIFTAFGVVADVIFLGVSINDIVEDFKADDRDDWKIADDFLFAASAGVGAALGR